VTNGAIITTTDYAGKSIYRNNALQFISQPEGYLELDGQGVYDYTYQYKDHLGDIRLSYKDISTTSIPVLQILEENNYYPFGLKHSGYNMLVFSANLALKYKYNGKELNDELGLDWYDYGARFYDPTLGRWHVPDPLSQFHSLYNYAANNPISMIDPSGMWSYNTTYENGSDGFNEIIEEFGIGTNSTSSSEDNEEETPDDPPGFIYCPSDTDMDNMIFGKAGEQGKKKEKDASKTAFISIEDIMNYLGLSASVIENGMVASYLSLDQMKNLLISKGASVDMVNKLISRDANIGGVARIGGRLIFYGQAGYNVYVMLFKNPTAQNIAITSLDTYASYMATYGGWPGIGIAAVYYLGKGSIVLTMKGLEDGTLKLNPNITQNYIGGLAPSFVVPN
jgi:RHS repeat-associated protein